ncbi:uncharacterized protein TNCT_95711 [Trichonephila clavata]|uniref:Uncharacterized protein n=1 Tax=Trichonephila clavata TaxID=2740835 RepID=A0A8X6I5E4_TRICU|nr:uncharacterized protein TNCT_717241 [Trichonephila clavata]GFQ98499.1 uncharacterized protein TNCT_95711 [Trichonephila clavata]
MNNRLHINSIIVFLEEASSFVAMYKNMSWEPPISISELNPAPVPLFARSIGIALTHHCMEEQVLLYEPEWSLLSGLEAATYTKNYLRALMNPIPNGSYHTYLYFVAFICHFCVQVIRLKRSEIVRHILVEAVVILYSRCNCYMDFANLIEAAQDYNSQHRAKHEES